MHIFIVLQFFILFNLIYTKSRLLITIWYNYQATMQLYFHRIEEKKHQN